jgi:hypothetical protein
MALDFRSMFSYWQQLGLVDVILPFLLLFAVVFGILQKVAIFTEGKDSAGKPLPNKKINAVIALALALLVVIPHVTGGYPGGVDIVDLMNRFLPQSVFLILVVIMALLLIGLVGPGLPSGVSMAVGTVAVVVLGLILLHAVSPYQLPLWLQFLSDPAFQALVIILIVFGLIVWFVTREPGPKHGEPGYRSLPDVIAEWFKPRQ